MEVDLLINCPWAINPDDVRHTLNYYLRDSVSDTPVRVVHLIRHHGRINTTARLQIMLNLKTKAVLELLNSHMGVTLVHQYRYWGDTKTPLVWSIHRPDRIPKKIEMILAT